MSEACFRPPPTLCRSDPGDSRDMPDCQAAVKVFLADDSVLIRDRVVAMLGDGVDIVGQAETPQGSIDGILAAQPDVVVLDVQLEGGFGLQVLRAVRQAAPNIAFVVFSNNASPAYRKRYLGAGAEEFLDKSTEFDQLARAVCCESRLARHAPNPQSQQRSIPMSVATLEAFATPVRIVPRQEILNLVLLKTQCSSCHLRALCLPCGMTSSEVERMDGLNFGRRRIKVGQTLYREGDRFQFIYAVRSGTFKSSLMLADGREQISGFYMAGELMGLDGVANGEHASGATALEDTEVCAIPYAHLTELAAGNSGMQHMLSRFMSREIVREHSLMVLLGSMNAEERLAAFLLNLSQRLKARGYSATEFHLRMSRAEIGSYLGMTLETVSRTFSTFQQQRLLDVDKRHIRVIDLDSLTRAFEIRLH